MQNHSNLLLLMNDNVMYWENWSERGFYSLKAAPLNSNLEFGLIAAWQSLLLYWNRTAENVFQVLQNIFCIFCWSQSSRLILFLFIVYPIHPKVSFITRWKMRVKAYRFFSLSTVWAGKLWKAFFLYHRCTFSSYFWPVIIYFSLLSHLHHCHFPSV